MKKIKKFLVSFAALILVLSIVYFSPVDRNNFKTRHFTFIYSDKIDKELILKLSGALEDNYVRISTDLKTKPYHNIEVYIYDQRWRYVKATGNWNASGNIEGVSKLHFIKKAWGENDEQKVAVHEFAHAVTLKLLIDQETLPMDSNVFDKKFSSFPIWLWEAISVYEAQQFVDPSTLSYMDMEHYPSLPELDKRLKGGKIYSCGYTIIEYILFKYGRDGFIRLIKNYGDLEATYHITDNQFSKDWHEFLIQKYIKSKYPI